MNFKDYLSEQMTLHPSTLPQDIVKQCYQAAFGAEHLLKDLSAAEAYFSEEYAQAPDSGSPLLEHISADVCRVNLSAWKRSKMPASWLFQMFALSSGMAQDGTDRFLQNLSDADNLICDRGAEFSHCEWTNYLAEYKSRGMGAVHHSAAYRAHESPAYRIVSRRLARLLPVLQKIVAAGRRSAPFVLALDGRSASGKTTAAEQLGLILDGSIVHMDDFFLPADMRTVERLAEPGGNVHYERFADEVLPQLKRVDGFSYRIFDCAELDYNGRRYVAAKPFYIVEGSYSCHPAFGDYADLRVFTDIDCDEQMARIIRRNGAVSAKQFRARWIPQEEQYFAAFKIKESADVRL